QAKVFDVNPRLDYSCLNEHNAVLVRRREHRGIFVNIFEVEAQLNSNVIGRGVGSSKRMAEQQAAKMALGYFGISCQEDA
ncbi:MAG: hypothetical protein IJX08_08485, partial [Clostridia bacterium]|nr:hypothetical protein [Clostridia bacterium]